VISFDEFLESGGALRIVREATGEALSGLGKVLPTGICGGNRLAYDITAVMVGPRTLTFLQDVISTDLPDSNGEGQDYLEVVTEMRAQTIARRMTARASSMLASSPLLKAVATTSGMPLPAVANGTVTAGNALLYLTEPGAPEEIALVVNCAGLSSLHNERYAEAIAALCKLELLGEWASIQALLQPQTTA